MKKVFFIMMLLLATNVSAQDVIVKKDGSSILSKVIEVHEDVVKYKKHENLNGPIYSISKSEVLCINYQNGSKETFSVSSEENSVTSSDVKHDENHLFNDEALLAIHHASNNNSVKALRTIGSVGGGILTAAGLCFTIVYIVSPKEWDGHKKQAFALPVGIGCFAAGAAIGLIFNLSASRIQRNKEEVLREYSLYRQNFNLNNGTNLTASLKMFQDCLSDNRTIGLGVTYNF